MEREIKIYNSKILKLLDEKAELVRVGRKESEKIDSLTKEIDELNKEEKLIVEKVEPKELIEEGTALNNKIQEDIKRLQEIGKKVQDIKIESIPKEMRDKHYALRDSREKLERERNKIALKVQKIKDRVIPLIQKEAVKSGLAETEEITEAVPKEGAISIKIVDVVEQFKQTFIKNRQAVTGTAKK